MKTLTRKQSPLRRLVQRYAHGEIERMDYLIQRRKLLGELQAQKVSLPRGPHDTRDGAMAPPALKSAWLLALGLALLTAFGIALLVILLL